MSNINLDENYGHRRTQRGVMKAYQGEIEFEIRDANTKQLIHRVRDHNIVKIFAKEILAHKLPHDSVWDPNADSGAGAWVNHGIDLAEFAPKYIVFGASYDAETLQPLDTADTRFYTNDNVTGGYVPVTLGVGAEYDGGLINAIPIAEPNRPLKRVERIFFESSYQPAGTPLLQADVRAMNNVIVFETVLRKDEYNGFDLTSGDFFTITEVALVGAAEVGSVGACECDPRDIFLTGDIDSNPLSATASGTDTITLDIAETEVDLIKEGDQVKIVDINSTASEDEILDQVSPYYLVTSKVEGGRDIVLDRTPVDGDGNPITGSIGVFRDGFRIFSHRVLNAPVRKNLSFEITTRWRIILS